MLHKLASNFDEVYVYYFDIPFEETLVRHASKSNTHEFGEKEMREWWNEKDYLNMPNEKILRTGPKTWTISSMRLFMI